MSSAQISEALWVGTALAGPGEELVPESTARPQCLAGSGLHVEKATSHLAVAPGAALGCWVPRAVLTQELLCLGQRQE